MLSVTIVIHMIQMSKKPTIMMSVVCSMAWSMIAVVAMNLGKIKIESLSIFLGEKVVILIKLNNSPVLISSADKSAKVLRF